MKNKLQKIAIFDFNNCNNCKKELLTIIEENDNNFISNNFIIINPAETLNEKLDICFIQGSPNNQTELDYLSNLRQRSKLIIALGACACIGAIPSLVKTKEKTNIKAIDQHIKVDHYLSGCPVDPTETKQLLADLANHKNSQEKTFTVCQECKAKHNKCLLLEGKACLGPITKGGCQALCPSNGLKCYGCRGLVKDANFQAMIVTLKKQGRNKKEIQKIMNLFLKENPKYQKHLSINKNKIKIKL